jgi:hypothetical protein
MCRHLLRRLNPGNTDQSLPAPACVVSTKVVEKDLLLCTSPTSPRPFREAVGTSVQCHSAR